MYTLIIKRCIDIMVSILSLVLLFPILAVLSIILLHQSGKPLLYCQQRPGRFAKPFIFYKFRSMSQICDLEGKLLPDAERFTSLGRLLRRSSLDELPSLFNVVKGEMSLVGPRPLLMEYINRYTPEQARRHDVKPGITGWAQVNGRNAISWEEKFNYDVWYVDNWSIWLDLKILWITLVEVIKMEGINQPGRATVDYFRGSVSENNMRQNE